MIDKREISPELLSRITAILFQRISAADVLRGSVCYNGISADEMAEVMLEEDYFRSAFSKLQCKSFAESVIDYTEGNASRISGRQVRISGSLNLFDLLILVLDDLLCMEQNRICCNYAQIHPWRLLVKVMGEEFPISARYATWDKQDDWSNARPWSYSGSQASSTRRQSFDDFSWPYVAGHNNKQLNAIVHRGISEHHSHLWGSTPFFHVSWVRLMNDVTNPQYAERFRHIQPPVTWDNFGRRVHQKPDLINHELYGAAEQLRAAWIRLYLCERLVSAKKPTVECICDRWHACDDSQWMELVMQGKAIQSLIDSYSFQGKRRTDYALALSGLQQAQDESDLEILIGERWLYYNIFADYLKPKGDRKLNDDDYNLFFAYFLLRLALRSRMVQNNDVVGFDNFQSIQDRKGFFTNDPDSSRFLARLAINETLKNPAIREMELRMSPSSTDVCSVEHDTVDFGGKHPLLLSERDREMQKQKQDALRDRFYYVFHFIKTKDPTTDKSRSYEQYLKTEQSCRHDALREKLMHQAQEIVRFREEQPQLASRVLGIDAASQEIGCRPEVFASAFRLLGEHQVSYGGLANEKRFIPMLGKTYHVGEDFLDIVDGLRAIHEAVLFLNLDCGDRLGHAIALGIDVEDWYNQKHRQISLPVQDYLDNLAWLYHSLSRLNTSDFGPLKDRIIKDFEHWFRVVYRNSISDERIRSIMDNARRNCYNITNEDHGKYQPHTLHFDISAYHRAWTLRGDDPSHYLEGYFKNVPSVFSTIPIKRCEVNAKFPFVFDDRYIPEYSLLNYLYQFNMQVREEGARQIKVDISADYIRAVKAVQTDMRYKIERRGLSIETNPTSNVLISSFRDYSKHPILKFFNRGLPITGEEETECAQLQVSVNTDDSGVFYTDLEMEYALLARSVETIPGPAEVNRFKKTDIYRWIDNIRVMGNDQTFKRD